MESGMAGPVVGVGANDIIVGRRECHRRMSAPKKNGPVGMPGQEFTSLWSSWTVPLRAAGTSAGGERFHRTHSGRDRCCTNHSSAELHRHEQLLSFALDQDRGALARLPELALE